jgi:chromosomal replication initiation ATPase DnaA
MKKGIGLYNVIKSFVLAKKQVFVTSVFPPEQLGISDQLLSLFSRGLTVPIFKPDAHLVGRIFKMISSDVGIDLSDDVISYLSGLPFNDIREIETVLKKMDLLKDVTKEITIKNVRDSVNLEEIVTGEGKSFITSYENSEFYDFIKVVKEGFNELSTKQEDVESLKEEYMQKLYIWKMKGFNVSRLEEAMDGPEDEIFKAFVTFTSDVERLIELQRRLGQLEKATTSKERDYFENNLFNPDATLDMEKKLKEIEERKRQKEEYNRYLHKKITCENYIVLPSNKESFMVLEEKLLKEKGVVLPIYIYGETGCGKTHLLVAFTKKMQTLYPERIIAYIPSRILIFEIKNLLDEEAKDLYMQKLKRINTIFLDGIEQILQDRESKSLFLVILKNFSEEKKRLIISSDLPLKELDIEDKYKDIILSGTVVSIKPLTEKDKKLIISSIFADSEIYLSNGLKEYLSENLDGKFSDIKRCVKEIKKEVVEKNQKLTIKNVAACLDLEIPEFIEEEEDERKVEEETSKEEISLQELDQKWPYLNERIFEDFKREKIPG